MSDAQQKVDELLVDWEAARLDEKNPRELTPTELCREHPELIEQVAEKIAILKRLSWVGDPFEVIAGPDNEENTLNGRGVTATNVKDGDSTDSALPESDLSMAEFVETLSDSGLFDDAGMELVDVEIRQLQDTSTSNDDQRSEVRNLAIRLINQSLLTEYQAKVILERGDSPLLLDRYVILDSIGAGGMGIVFKALQVTLDRIVAVKVLPRHFVDSPEKVERFKREMRAVAKLSHPNVVQAYDAHESNGVYFFAMEYVPGQDLANYVRERGVLAPEQAVSICAQIAKGLASAHQNGIIHRDVKPGNVLLSEDGTAKVLDLGLARTRELAQETVNNDLTRDGLTMGTMAYMSPEQAFDAKNADVRSDIYSLGCTLYFLIHGRPVFDDANSVRTIVSHREAPPPRLDAGQDGVTSHLESLYQRMLAKRPTDRPASMDEVHTELMKLNNAISSTTSAPISAIVPTSPAPTQQNPPTPPPLPPVISPSVRSNNSLWKWIAAGLAMALMLATGFIVGRGRLNSNAGIADLSPAEQRTKEIAEQLLVADGSSLIVVKDDLSHEIYLPEELPAAPFEIIDVTVFTDDLTGLPLIDELPELEALSVYGDIDDEGQPLDVINDFQTDLEGLASSTPLVALHLEDCVLTDAAIERIGALKNLDSLAINRCELPPSDLAPLSRLSLLNMLSIDQCNLTDSQIAAIRSIPDLRYLDVSESNITAAGVAEVSEMNSLRDLYLVSVPVEAAAEALGGMAKLKYLDVSGSDLTDDGLAQLQQCKKLQVLTIAETAVTKEAIVRFESARPRCEVIVEVDDEF